MDMLVKVKDGYLSFTKCQLLSTIYNFERGVLGGENRLSFFRHRLASFCSEFFLEKYLGSKTDASGGSDAPA